MTKFLNISIDNTLGGTNSSDITVSSQKAIKGYVDTIAASKQDLLGEGTNIVIDENNVISCTVEVPTKTSDLDNDSGFIDKNVNDLLYYTLSSSLATVATSGKYTDLSDTPDIPTKTSDLTNDSGFIDKNVNDLVNYTATSELAAVALSGDYDDLDNKLTIEQTATSTSTTAVLAANVGKILQDQISNLQSVGRFLSIWNCATGLPTSNPQTSPYTYHTGDYYIVGIVDNISLYPAYDSSLTYNKGDRCSHENLLYICNSNEVTGEWDSTKWDLHTLTNYRPDGPSYTIGVRSEVVENENVRPQFVYMYDNTNWNLVSLQGEVDQITINYNSDGEYTALGTINKKDLASAIYNWTGTLAEYNALETKYNNWLYYITDDHIPVELGYYTKVETDALLALKANLSDVHNNTITITQGGVTKGSFTLNQNSDSTIALDAGGSLVSIDNLSITTNTDDELQTVGTINQNNAIEALKEWKGTLAEYNAIETKDNSTKYYITDDNVLPSRMVEDVQVNGTSVVVDNIANVSVPTVNNNTVTINQGGTQKGTFTLNQNSDVTIDLDAGSGGSVSIDNDTITKNSSDQIQTVGIKNTNSGTSKVWTGTLAQYNAIETKDNNTIYNITDDTNNNIIYQNGSRNVGDIFYTTRTDTALNGAVRCNGNTYQTTDFLGDNNIGILLRTNKVMYVSMADYATAIATYGYCKSFGWDGGVTTAFKVPTLPDMPLGEMPVNASTTEMGDSSRITVKFNGNDRVMYASAASNYELAMNTVDYTGANGNSLVADLTTADSYHAYVHLSTGATDTAISTCTSVLADVSSLNAHRVIAFQEPTAENNYTWYRKYNDGWVEQGGQPTTTSKIVLLVPMATSKYWCDIHIIVNTNNAITFSTRGYSLTTTGFSYNNASTAVGNIQWVVCGKYAQE